MKILQERKTRERRLQETELGWCNLAGLFWLKEGENKFGSDPLNDIVLSRDSALAQAGVFTLKNGVVSIHVNKNGSIASNGKIISSKKLLRDKNKSPDYITLGDLTMLVIQRGEKYLIRLWQKNNPYRKHSKGLCYYPVDPQFRIIAEYFKYDKPKIISVIDVIGTVYDYLFQVMLFSNGLEKNAAYMQKEMMNVYSLTSET